MTPQGFGIRVLFPKLFHRANAPLVAAVLQPVAHEGVLPEVEVPELLGIPRFRNYVLKRTSDSAIKHWFKSYFD